MKISSFKYRWKKLFFTAIVIMAGVASFVAIRSAVKVSDDYVTKYLTETPQLKTLIVWSEDLYTEEQLNNLMNDDRVLSSFEFNFGISMKLQNSNSSMDVYVTPYHGAYDEYIIKGRGVEGEKEIVLPYYTVLEESGKYSVKKTDKSVVGSKVNLTYARINTYTGEFVEEISVELDVVGLIDNIGAGLSYDGYLLHDERLTEIQIDNVYIPESEEEWKEVFDFWEVESKEELDTIFGEERKQGELGICTKTYADSKELEEEYGLFRYSVVNEDVVTEFHNLDFIGSILVLVLLFMALINIVLSTLSDINKRSWEFALKQSMGYRLGRLYREVIQENILVAVVGMIFGVAAGYGLLQIIRVNYMAVKDVAYLTMKVGLSKESIIMGMIIAVIAPLAGTIIGMIKIKSIDIAATLKNKE